MRRSSSFPILKRGERSSTHIGSSCQETQSALPRYIASKPRGYHQIEHVPDISLNKLRKLLKNEGVKSTSNTLIMKGSSEFLKSDPGTESSEGSPISKTRSMSWPGTIDDVRALDATWDLAFGDLQETNLDQRDEAVRKDFHQRKSHASAILSDEEACIPFQFTEIDDTERATISSGSSRGSSDSLAEIAYLASLEHQSLGYPPTSHCVGAEKSLIFKTFTVKETPQNSGPSLDTGVGAAPYPQKLPSDRRAIRETDDHNAGMEPTVSSASEQSQAPIPCVRALEPILRPKKPWWARGRFARKSIPDAYGSREGQDVLVEAGGTELSVTCDNAGFSAEPSSTSRSEPESNLGLPSEEEIVSLGGAKDSIRRFFIAGATESTRFHRNSNSRAEENTPAGRKKMTPLEIASRFRQKKHARKIYANADPGTQSDVADRRGFEDRGSSVAKNEETTPWASAPSWTNSKSSGDAAKGFSAKETKGA